MSCHFCYFNIVSWSRAKSFCFPSAWFSHKIPDLLTEKDVFPVTCCPMVKQFFNRKVKHAWQISNKTLINNNVSLPACSAWSSLRDAITELNSFQLRYLRKLWTRVCNLPSLFLPSFLQRPTGNAGNAVVCTLQFYWMVVGSPSKSRNRTGGQIWDFLTTFLSW